MANDAKLDHLKDVRLFSSCTKKELTHLGRASDEITVPAGKVIVEEGSFGHDFFMILEGEADVTVGKKKVASLGPGGYFGELAILDRAPRNATVTARTPMRLLLLGQREFSSVLDEVPGLAHKLLVQMAGRLREQDAKAVSH